MKTINQAMGFIIGIPFVLTVMISCATVPDLKVNYRLPLRSEELKGKKVFLVFEDKRTIKDILGEGARKEFKYFSGNISLSLARGKEEGFKLGLYNIPSLFIEVFKRRLENLGVEVVPEREKGQTQVVIVLKDLLLDLIDRKWVVKMAYEVRIVKDDIVLAKQMISGECERLKLVRQRQADIVISELFTDMVNRLDVGSLFRQGK